MAVNKRHIAIIYEGNKTEKMLIQNIQKNFFKKNQGIIPIAFPAGENIYMLWNQLNADQFETDVIEVLREYNDEAKKALANITRDEISEVYLFFDYDGHADNIKGNTISDDIIQKMLETFDNETEMGKLYINYPMVESLRDNRKKDCCYRCCYVQAHKNIHYKHLVSDLKDFQDFRHILREDWQILCTNTLKKANCIVTNNYAVPDYETFEQSLGQKYIFKKQKEKFLCDKNIAVLNGFPMFILEYVRKSVWRSLMEENPDGI